MWREEHKPLSLGLWASEMEKLAAFCAEENADREDLAVRRAFVLSKIAPMAIRKLQRPYAAESDVERALGRNAAEQAARIVLGELGNIDVVNGAVEGRHIATLTPKGDPSVSFEAASAALAIVGAWSSFLTTAQPD